MKRFIILTTMALLPCQGCTTWDLAVAEYSPLHPPKMPAESIVLETCELRLGEEEAEAVWRLIDEQRVPALTRQRMRQNGLRIGVAGITLPKPIEMALPGEASAGSRPIAFDPVSDDPAKTWRKQVRLGAPVEVLAAPQIPETQVLLRGPDDSVRGETVAAATALLSVTAQTVSEGRIEFTFEPEIRHGSPLREYRVESGAIQSFVEQARVEIGELKARLLLSPGETVVVSARPGMRKSVGGHIFDEAASSDAPGRKLLLVRLAQTQYDPAFSYESSRERDASESKPPPL